jgi:hypothetical protein
MKRLCVCACARARISRSGSHQWFDQFEQAGDEAMRYFLEPIVLVRRRSLLFFDFLH